MELHPIFKIREESTPAIIELLDQTVLGTNGAQYRHLDTKEKIKECDNPLFISMERSERVLGNITFCRRNDHWYIRYFAFDKQLRSAGKTKSKRSSENFLKQEVEKIFQLAFNGKFGQRVSSFYAYVDPKNVRSLWMSEQFGFVKMGAIATQSFSRYNPKSSARVKKISNWDEVKDRIRTHFSDYQYYFEEQTKNPPYYVLVDHNGSILASAKIRKAEWEINRLPGKTGGFQVKMIPFIPWINKLIKPKKHAFVVVEAVTANNHDHHLIEELFTGMLKQEKMNALFWWVDMKDKLYSSIRTKTKWGPMHSFVGAPEAFVMCKRNPESIIEESSQPVYTVGLDFI